MGETVNAIISTPRTIAGESALYVGLTGDEPRSPPARFGLAAIDRVDICRGSQRSAVRRIADGSRLLVPSLADSRLSSQHARVTRLGSNWFVEDLKSKNGTHIARTPIVRHQLHDGDAFIVGHTVLVFRDQGGEAEDLDSHPNSVAAGLSTCSASLASRFEELAAAARSTVPIEITGASGTGKELAARAVHQLSGRSGRFAAVNCGALSPTLLEAELFGHNKGAFTGAADDRAGVIRTSDRGTLFLDEVAELPALSQTALLRVLQDGEVVPLGADRPVAVDLRIVTATHKPLDLEVAAQRFRADLRARLLGVQFELPRLRDRREDLCSLIATLLERLAPRRALRSRPMPWGRCMPTTGRSTSASSSEHWRRRLRSRGIESSSSISRPHCATRRRWRSTSRH